MARGPRGPRKRTGPIRPKPPVMDPMAYADDDEDIDLRDTPEYKRRQLIIRIGTSILLFAFLSTSGITCIASGMSTPPEEENTATNVVQRVQSEIDRLREAVKKDPKDFESMGMLGVYLIEDARGKDPEQARKLRSEAREQFEAVLKIKPDNYQMYQYLGASLLDEGDLGKAEESFKKALELSSRPVDPAAPDKDMQQSQQDTAQVESRIGLAGVNWKRKNYDQALQELDAALKLNPGYARGYLLRAKVQMDRKQPEAARRDLQLALDAARMKSPQEQQEILMEYAAAMKILDPKGTATPEATPAPVASATPATPAPETTPASSANTSTSGNASNGNSTTGNASLGNSSTASNASTATNSTLPSGPGETAPINATAVNTTTNPTATPTP